jgi:RNA polymerase sigma-70 factor (sigma-E family)
MAERPEFDEFVAVRSPALLRTAYLLTGNWATAEDLLQTSLTSCWRGWSRIQGSPEAYVQTAILRTYLSWTRRLWTRETPTEVLPDASRLDASTEVDERDLVWSALARLPRRQRAVVVLRYYLDLTEDETARLLGVTVGTVKSQNSKALATLRIDSSLRPSLDEVR